MLHITHETLLHLHNFIQNLCDRIVFSRQTVFLCLHKLYMFCSFVGVSCEVNSQRTSLSLLQNATSRNSSAGSGNCDSVNGTLPTESVLSQCPNAFLECGTEN